MMGKCFSMILPEKHVGGDFQSKLVGIYTEGNYEDKYEVLDDSPLGEGITGSVSKIICKTTGEAYAMKSINVSRFDKSQLKELEKEIEFVKNLDHPNIIRLREVYKSKNNIHMIMTLLSGGHLISNFPKRANQVAKIAIQLLSACKYWHSRNIVHRDLKPENIMYTTNHPNSDIQVIDFGLSTWFAINQTKAPVSSRFSSAFFWDRRQSSALSIEESHPQNPKKTKKRKLLPIRIPKRVSFKSDSSVHSNSSRHARQQLGEQKLKRILQSQVGSVFNGNGYNHKVDTWAIGVILYLLITRKWPFMAETGEAVGKLVKEPPSYDSTNWKKMGPDARILVENLLKVDPDERLSAAEALNSNWLQNYESSIKANFQLNGDLDEVIELEKDCINSFRRFMHYTKLKKAALMVIAHKANTDKIQKLRKVFQQLDIYKTGTITPEELRIALERHNITGTEVNTLFADLDQDRSGHIRYMEFLAATIETQKHISAEEMSIAFDHLDTDSSGYITKKNLQSLLGKQFSKDDVEEIIRESDLTNDGQISKAEFMTLMRSKQNKLLIETMQTAENQNMDATRSQISSQASIAEDVSTESTENQVELKTNAEAKEKALEIS